MAIQQYGLYTKDIIPDGTSTSVALDFFGQIANDSALTNRTPVSVYAVNDSFGNSNAASTLSASVSGSVVTFTWATPPAANTLASVNVYLVFAA